MRFIFYSIILTFGSFLNSNILNALTLNEEKVFSSFSVFKCYNNYNLFCNIKDININLINTEVDENKTFLNDSLINSVDSFSTIDLLKKEVESLNNELEKLNQKLSNLENENLQLKLSLDKITVREQNKAKADALIVELQKEAREFRANNTDQYIPDQYAKALNLLVIGEIDLASKYLQEVSANSSEDKKNTGLDPKDRQSIKDIYISYSNYWLGKINIIKNNYNTAAQYFAECYRISECNTLSLKSLVGLIESLTNLARSNEACTAIKQFDYDYQKAIEQEKNFSFPGYYLKLIEKYKSINRC